MPLSFYPLMCKRELFLFAQGSEMRMQIRGILNTAG
ncbi:hypothetical protein Cassandra_0380 [Pseudomonas phage Cassandra]|nr:hypothetical protein Cassandra_0380 [Pseudomonas phage Cassandra]